MVGSLGVAGMALRCVRALAASAPDPIPELQLCFGAYSSLAFQLSRVSRASSGPLGLWAHPPVPVSEFSGIFYFYRPFGRRGLSGLLGFLDFLDSFGSFWLLDVAGFLSCFGFLVCCRNFGLLGFLSFLGYFSSYRCFGLFGFLSFLWYLG